MILDWRPQPRQARLFEAAGLLAALDGAPPRPPVARAIGYGGAAGGGKSDADLALAVAWAIAYRESSAAGGGKSDADLALAVAWAIAYRESSVAVFRRRYVDLEGTDGLVGRGRALLAPLQSVGGALWRESDHRWTFGNGSQLKFCGCQTPGNVYDYQSQAFDLFIVDEATHFTWEMIDYLLTRNRPTRDWIPHSLAVFTTNPGNVGHLWFKSLFVDLPPEQPAPAALPGGGSAVHYFIPARLDDNPILDRRGNGAYRRTLLARDTATRRALLEGDWDSFTGQAFPARRRDLHTCPPFPIPEHWRRWRAVDWGFSNPFCCLAAAQDPDTGRVFVTHELYERGLTDRAQARLILDRLPPAAVTYGDPSMWSRQNYEDTTFSTADEYAAEGVPLIKADNDRLNGKRKVAGLLEGLPAAPGPGLVIFETCLNLIRTLPALPSDPLRVEDVDTAAEDHAYDCLRYLLSRVNPRPRRQAPPAARRAVPDRIQVLAGRAEWGLEEW